MKDNENMKRLDDEALTDVAGGLRFDAAKCVGKAMESVQDAQQAIDAKARGIEDIAEELNDKKEEIARIGRLDATTHLW